MDPTQVKQLIQDKFAKTGNPAQVPLIRHGTFKAILDTNGVYVDNLGNQPFLSWSVFQETIRLLIDNNGRVLRGNAMGPRLGEPELLLNSIEGHIAYIVYKKQPGDAVFRRITPIACILIWAGVCEHLPNELLLRYRSDPS
jgi:hypothetical protein